VIDSFGTSLLAIASGLVAFWAFARFLAALVRVLKRPRTPSPKEIEATWSPVQPREHDEPESAATAAPPQIPHERTPDGEVSSPEHEESERLCRERGASERRRKERESDVAVEDAQTAAARARREAEDEAEVTRKFEWRPYTELRTPLAGPDSDPPKTDLPTVLKDRSPRPTAAPRLFTDVLVFFGTNRSKLPGVAYYGTDRDVMHYGECVVNVPTDRRIGSIPTPSLWTFYRARPDSHFFVRDVTERDKQAFVSRLRCHLRTGSNQALVFVHGFNVPFVDAVYRTAQISTDLGFDGAPVLFSWPSQGSLSPLAYTMDETQARWALPDLRAFLELFIEHSGADAIHLLAHSMGNRALTEAIAQMGSAFKNGPAAFTELILTAPDIDADTFTREIAPSILPSSKRVTLYASANDKALAFSKTVHGYRRAGDTGQDITVLDGVDTIDVSAVDTNFYGHFYYGSNKTVLSDMFYLMQGNPVTKRFSLKNRQLGEKTFWVFQP
jgi:esterase/lipase superfamily enzyme